MQGIHPLKAYRQNAGITQHELAELLGVSRTTVARWESGTRKVETDRLGKIVDATGIAARDLRPDLARALAHTVKPNAR